MKTLNIVEVGGEGGVYQHVLGAAEHGTYEAWDRVVLHTSKDAECYPDIPGLEYHHCMRWQRSGPRLWRRVVTMAWAVIVLLPHLAGASWFRREEWEVQGQFGRGIYILFVLLPRLAKRRTLFAPHNSFLRHGGAWEEPILRIATSLASITIVYVASEAVRFPAARAIEQRVLWQYAPSVDENLSDAWRARLAGDLPVVLFAGQLRTDKNPLLLVEAANALEFPVCVVFAGQDKGAAEEIRQAELASQHRLILEDRYLELGELVSLMQLCDVVVCPYQVASQSGIVALASQLDRPVIVSSAGGLSEQSSWSFGLGEDQSSRLADVIRQVLATQDSTGDLAPQPQC